MRERLAQKMASKSGDNKSSGPVLAFLPGPKSTLLAGRSIHCFIWILGAVLACLALFTGACMPLIAFSVVHFVYLANFSWVDVTTQLAVIYLAQVLLGFLVEPLRNMIYPALILNVIADIAVGYNLFERVLYCFPQNRPDNDDFLGPDLVMRVFMEPPKPSHRPGSKAFSVRPAARTVGSDGFDWQAKGKK